MGGGVSASLVGMANDLALNGEEKRLYKDYYVELAKRGYSEQKIRKMLITRFEYERLNTPSKKLSTSVPRQIHVHVQPTNLVNDFEQADAATKIFYELITNSTKQSKDLSQKSSKALQIMSTFNDSIVISASPTSNSLVTHQFLNQVGVHGHDSIAHTTMDSSAVNFSCSLCQTTFSTSAQLQRHFKYSDKHARAVQANNDTKALAEKASRLSHLAHEFVLSMMAEANQNSTLNVAARRWHWAMSKVKAQNSIERTTQIIIKAYQKRNLSELSERSKMIYNGSKFFWRSQRKVDVHVCHHVALIEFSSGRSTSVIEIVGYCNDKHRELGRLYLAYDMLEKLLESELRSAEILCSTSHHRRSMSAYLADSNTDHVRNDVIINFIIKHLQVERISGTAGIHRLVLQSGSKEDDMNDLLGETPTMNLSIAAVCVPYATICDFICPVRIIRRRRSTEEERTATLSELSVHTTELSFLTKHAEAVAGILGDSLSTFGSLQKAHDKTRGFTKEHDRWYTSVRRVMRQIRVEKATNHVDELKAHRSRGSEGDPGPSASIDGFTMGLDEKAHNVAARDIDHRFDMEA